MSDAIPLQKAVQVDGTTITTNTQGRVKIADAGVGITQTSGAVLALLFRNGGGLL